MNFGSLSDIISSGSPWNLNIELKKAFSYSTGASLSLEGTKFIRLVRRSSHVVVASYPSFALRKCLMKSVASDPHLLVGVPNGEGIPRAFCNTMEDVL